MKNKNHFIFVCGMSRSGTTLLTTILDSHPSVSMGYELLPSDLPSVESMIDILAKQINLQQGKINDICRVLKEEGLSTFSLFLKRCNRTLVSPEDFLELLNIYRHQKDLSIPTNELKFRFTISKLVVEKKMEKEKTLVGGFKLNAPAFEEVYSWRKNSKFLYILRDPRDVVASHSEREFDKTIPQIIQSWQVYLEKFVEFQTRYPDRAYLIRYEDLVSLSDRKVREIIDFCDLPYRNEVRKFFHSKASIHTTGHVNKEKLSRDFFTSSIGRWKNDLSAEIVNQIQRDCNRQMNNFNYTWKDVKQDIMNICQLSQDKITQKEKEFFRKRKHNFKEYYKIIEENLENRINLTYHEAAIGERADGKGIALVRHDIDHDIQTALKIAEWENKNNVRATYCVLHTAWYYGEFQNGKYTHYNLMIENCKKIQDLGHEINLHNNFVVLALQTGRNPFEVLEQELEFFDFHGIKVTGTSTHGDRLCRELDFRNYELFSESVYESRGGARNISWEGNQVVLGSRSMKEFGLLYEAYDFPRDLYITDSGGNIRVKENTRGRAGLKREDMESSIKYSHILGILTHPLWWDVDNSLTQSSFSDSKIMTLEKNTATNAVQSVSLQEQTIGKILDRETVLRICNIDEEGKTIIESTSFASQQSFNPRRGLKVANILSDKFQLKHFQGKKIIELGPGHYAFALLARHLGAKVVCVERDPHFAQLGRYLGFEVLEIDFAELHREIFDKPFDGLWMKGSFNACNYKDKDAIVNFVDGLTELLSPDSWGWMVTVNKASADTANMEEFVIKRIEIQRCAFANAGWDVSWINDFTRSHYSLKYTGSLYYFTRGIEPPGELFHQTSVSESEQTQTRDFLINQCNLEANNKLMSTPASSERPFNLVQTLWQPTPEYYLSSWDYFVKFIDICKHRQVNFLTMSQALAGEYKPEEINLLLDHHIDFYPVETHVMCRWELENKIVSNIYLFNRSPYTDAIQRKMWKVEDLDINFYKSLEEAGFEIGYHQNAIGVVSAQALVRDYKTDFSSETLEEARKVFAEDVDNLRKYFNIRTFIPHGAGEGNSQLFDLPSNYQDLAWVYNNASRNKSVTPPIKWKNYSDSCGQSAQRIRGFSGEYITRRGNLHLAAWMLEPGLNHVLVHPGRFSRGMPYELYSGSVDLEGAVTRQEYEFSESQVSLPVSSKSFIKQWFNTNGGNSKRNQKGFLFTDRVETIQSWLGEYDFAIPVLVKHRKITDDEKLKYKVKRPATKIFDLPKSRELSHLSTDEINREFEEQFSSFFNLLFSDKILRHLAEAGIKASGIFIQNLKTNRLRDAEYLVSVLLNTEPDAEIFIRICILAVEPSSWRSRLDSEWEKVADSLSHLQKSFYKSENELILDISSLDDRQTNYNFKEVKNQQVNNIEDSDSFEFNDREKQQSDEQVIENQAQISEQVKEKAKIVSKARGESLESVLNRFSTEDIAQAPNSFSKHIPALRQATFVETGMKDDLAFVRTMDGKIFYGYPSQNNHRRAYQFVCDLLPDMVTEDTFLVCLDVVQRYATDFTWPPEEVLPPRNGTVVECGAYLGYKTIRFAEELVPNGKVLAIEMMPDNVEVLRRNIDENGLADRVSIIEAGVWNQPGTLVVKGKGRQRNTLVNLEKLSDDIGVEARVDTLDNLLDEWEVESVDFMFITVNGAEIEAIQGLNQWQPKVKGLFVAAPYQRDGQPNSDICRNLLQEGGYSILPSSNTNRVIAKFS